MTGKRFSKFPLTRTMEITQLTDPTLTTSSVSKFVTRQGIKINDLSGGQYLIRFKTPMLRSDLCNNSNAYIAVR